MHRMIGSSTGTGLGQEKVRLGVADFKVSGADPRNDALLKTFNDTLWNDLDNAGIFDMASKSFYPLAQPGTPGEVKLDAWAIRRPMSPCWHSGIWEWSVQIYPSRAGSTT